MKTSQAKEQEHNVLHVRLRLTVCVRKKNALLSRLIAWTKLVLIRKPN